MSSDSPWPYIRPLSSFLPHRPQSNNQPDLAVKLPCTGYGSAELDVVWKQVRPHLEHLWPKIGHDMTKSYFLCVYIMIHIGVRIQSVNLISTPSTDALSVTTYYDHKTHSPYGPLPSKGIWRIYREYA